jgi:hypothetical protein
MVGSVRARGKRINITCPELAQQLTVWSAFSSNQVFLRFASVSDSLSSFEDCCITRLLGDTIANCFRSHATRCISPVHCTSAIALHALICVRRHAEVRELKAMLRCEICALHPRRGGAARGCSFVLEIRVGVLTMRCWGVCSGLAERAPMRAGVRTRDTVYGFEYSSAALRRSAAALPASR